MWVKTPGCEAAPVLTQIKQSSALELYDLTLLRPYDFNMKLDFMNKSVSKHFMEASLKFNALTLLGFAWFPPNEINKYIVQCLKGFVVISFGSWRVLLKKLPLLQKVE